MADPATEIVQSIGHAAEDAASSVTGAVAGAGSTITRAGSGWWRGAVALARGVPVWGWALGGVGLALLTASVARAAAAEPPLPGPDDPGPEPGPEPDPGPLPLPGPGAPIPGPVPGGGLSENIAEREEQIFQAVAAGAYVLEWEPLHMPGDVVVDVTRMCLRITEPELLVVSVSYRLAQRLADLLGAMLLTTRVSDEVWRQAPTRLKAITQPWSQDGTMARTYRMREQSEAILAAVGGASGWVANEGKDWVLTRRFWLPPAGTGTSGKLHRSANFGWYGGESSSPGGEAVIQSVGLAHDLNHVDYSQVARFQSAVCLVSGVERPTAEVLADPTTSMLLQDEGGTIPAGRHPDL